MTVENGKGVDPQSIEELQKALAENGKLGDKKLEEVIDSIRKETEGRTN